MRFNVSEAITDIDSGSPTFILVFLKKSKLKHNITTSIGSPNFVITFIKFVKKSDICSMLSLYAHVSKLTLIPASIAITKNIKAIQEKPEKEKARIISRIEKVVRKLAHFSIYTVVGILLMFLFETFSMEEINRFSISLIIGVIYASSDEIHQCFTPRKRSTNYRCYFR